MQETRVQFLGQEDPLKKKMVTHSSILAWRARIHGQRSLAGYSPWDCKELDTIEQLSSSTWLIEAMERRQKVILAEQICF